MRQWLRDRFLAVQYGWRLGTLLSFAAFVWIFILGFRDGSFSLVIRPFFAIVAMLLAKEWIQRQEPAHGRMLAVVLTALVLAFNLLSAVQRYLPNTVKAAVAFVGIADQSVPGMVGTQLGDIQDDIRKYDEERIRTARVHINQQLAEINARRATGSLSDEDLVREEALFEEQKELARQSVEAQAVARELKAIAETMPGQSSSPRASPTATLPSPTPPLSIDAPPRPAATRLSSTEDDRVEDLERILNAVSAVDGTRIATVVKAEPLASSVGGFFLTALQARDARVMADVIQSQPFIERGYFDEAAQGSVATMRKTSLFAKVQYLLIASLTQVCGKKSTLDDELVSCNLDVRTKLIDRSGAVIGSEAFTAVGAGFSEAESLAQAANRAASTVGVALMRTAQ